MHLTDEQIIDLLIEYVTDNRYKQAVLIDGDWGSGKTYFIQEKLVSSLKSKIENGPKQKRSVLYISLYGMESFSQIIDDIYAATLESFFDKKLGDGTGEKIGKCINIASKLVTTGMKYFNLDKDDLPELSDIKEIKDSVIIFDDLERCAIETNQLLGFINNLVEHNAIKVIIVANQKEIGKPKLLNDLPQKYSVILNPHLKLKESKDKIAGKQQEAHVALMDVKELQTYTEQIFSEDLVYEKIKEKLIGLTINYRADFNSIYEEIISKYIKNIPTKERLIINKDLVLSIFDKRHHNNIRTLIFALIAYEKIFITISEIHFEPLKFFEEQCTKLLKYTLEVSIQIKTGQQLYSWTNSTSQTGTVYLGKGNMWEDGVFGYRFVDTYLTTRFFDSDEAKSIILGIMNEQKEIEQHRATEDALSYNKLYTWWYLEDEEVSKLLDSMLKELSEKKYHPRYFKDMIILLMQLQHANFSPFNYSKLCKDFVCSMKQRLEQNTDEIDIERLEVLSDDPDFISKYNSIMKPIFDFLNEKKRIEKEKVNENLDLDKSWGDAFKADCIENRSSYLMEKKFLFYIIPKKVIDKIRESAVKDIYSFLEGIKVIYSFSNLNDFFKDDLSHIDEILELLNIDELSNGKHTKRIALEKLKRKLEESKELIEK